ncbi:hypothetical protein PIB30_032033 [Stylosanthes scabra]|uniref:Uncharacterized protein n=1 Tax=Stylosanthes scabra TaxID=79078 RepID=A0ABU6X9S5_9FABA|nr:hypothetical protein [Stylosanthes scabra]
MIHHSFIRVCSVAATLHINNTSIDTCTVVTPPHENAASIAINVVHLRSFTRHVSFSEVYEALAPSGLALFILDEIGSSIHCQHLFFAHVPVAGNLSSCSMPEHELCEDG